MVLCLVVAGLAVAALGLPAGWVLQGLILLSGFVVPAMFFIGGLFALLWVVGLRVGRRGEELHAERWAEVDDPRTAPPGPAG